MEIVNKIFGKIVIPLSYYLRGDYRYLYFSRYTKNMSKSHDEIMKYQLQRLQKLLKHSYDTVPYYNKLFDRLGIKPEDFMSLDDLRKLPLLTKKDVLQNFEQLKSTDSYKTIEISSGGSTGNRVTVLKDKRYHEISRAVVLRDLYSLGISPGSKVAWVWGSPLENKPLTESLLHRFQWSLNRRIIFNTFSYTDKQLETWLKTDFSVFKPDYIYGYANAIYDIAKFIDSRNIKVPEPKMIVCSAQKLEQRDYIEKIFGCKVYDHYGSREVESIGIEDQNYVMHTSDDFVIVEIGENSEIILTPLESYAMPLLRYVNGDIGLMGTKKGRTPHPFNEFNIVVGRNVEILRSRDGQKIYSGKINLLIAKNKLSIGEFQLVQNSYDEADLNIVKDETTDKKDVAKLSALIKKTLGTKKVTVNYLNTYPLEKSGKKIGYKCLIQDENPNN